MQSITINETKKSIYIFLFVQKAFSTKLQIHIFHHLYLHYIALYVLTRMIKQKFLIQQVAA